MAPWDNLGVFSLAPTMAGATVVMVTARCNLPGHHNCTMSVVVGNQRTLPEARRLLMTWCIDGIWAESRDDHMVIVPSRDYQLSEIGTEEELLKLANATLEDRLGLAQQ